MKIGIFGGSFNPIHNMHLEIARALIDKGYVNKIVFVPTGDNYNKKDLLPFNHRFNMIKYCLEKDIDVSDFEKGELKYTYQTLDYFKSIYKDDEIYFICGADNYNSIDKWKNSEYILNNFKIIVINRDNLNIIIDDNVIVADIESNSISSSKIRSNIEEYKDYINKNVLKYIERNSLYK